MSSPRTDTWQGSHDSDERGGQGDAKDWLVTNRDPCSAQGAHQSFATSALKKPDPKTPSGQPQADLTSALNSPFTNSLPHKSPPTAKMQAP